jgi:hypothetical protein
VATIGGLWGFGTGFALAFGILIGVLAQARSAKVAMDYVDGLLGEVAANCWALAEVAGHPSPRRMQDLLGCYVWDWPDLQAELPGYAVAQLPCLQGDIAGRDWLSMRPRT